MEAFFGSAESFDWKDIASIGLLALVVTDTVQLVCRALQIQSAKELCVCSDNNSGETHRDCTDAHGEIESPVDEKTRGDRDSDQVISGSPNEILDHLSVGSA